MCYVFFFAVFNFHFHFIKLEEISRVKSGVEMKNVQSDETRRRGAETTTKKHIKNYIEKCYVEHGEN